jgi:hypothetical protein
MLTLGMYYWPEQMSKGNWQKSGIPNSLPWAVDRVKYDNDDGAGIKSNRLQIRAPHLHGVIRARPLIGFWRPPVIRAVGVAVLSAGDPAEVEDTAQP